MTLGEKLAILLGRVEMASLKKIDLGHSILMQVKQILVP